MKIQNSPIDILLKVFRREYPETASRVRSIAFGKTTDKDAFAETIFADDGSNEIHIVLSTTVKGRAEITFTIATELLAHELAHAVVGASAGHDEMWESVSDRLFELYNEEAQKETEIFAFDEILEELTLRGQSIARQSWSVGAFLYYVPEGRYIARTDIAKGFAGQDGKVAYAPYIALKKANGEVEPWNPTTADILAKDWFVFGGGSK